MHHQRRDGRYGGKPSIAETLIETLSETLGRGAVRPPHERPAGSGGGRAHLALGLAALVALAAAGAVFLRLDRGRPTAAERVGVVELARGPLGVVPAGDRPAGAALLTLAAGEPIHAGAVLDTGRPGAGGRAALRLAGGQSLRLDQGSRVRLASSASVVLEGGAVYVDSGGGAPIEVRTALGVVRDVGTRFEVRLLPGAGGGVLRVRVRDGEVVLERDGETHPAAAGEELAVAADGRVRRAASPVYGPRWDWVLDAAPAPDVAGRRLAVFLDWLEREGGWTVRFADDAAAARAANTILHGDLRDLTPVQASSMVLGSAGLAYRLEAGDFIVERIDERAARR
ncbi:MAG: hypothetical protein D6696_16260 [Acidobacteria bacterium]|nr:MAG: hypothetical protein D6696_16260 [Acidobacteriota bacterium]